MARARMHCSILRKSLKTCAGLHSAREVSQRSLGSGSRMPAGTVPVQSCAPGALRGWGPHVGELFPASTGAITHARTPPIATICHNERQSICWLCAAVWTHAHVGNQCWP